MQRLNNSTIEQQAIDLLANSNQPCSINYIANHLNIAWVTAQALLLKLVIGGKVIIQETTTGMVFWVSRESGVAS